MIVLLIIAGAVGGTLGGMGMGGGTLLIPILTIFLDVPQNIAQWINLLSFIPMAVIAIIIHAKNKLIDKKPLLILLIPALIAAAVSAYFASSIDSAILKKTYGIFIIFVGGISLCIKTVFIIKNKKQKNDNELSKNKGDLVKKE